MGMIKFGSRTDLIVPEGSDIRVEKGQVVRGGQTVIGYLPAAGRKQPGVRSEGNARI